MRAFKLIIAGLVVAVLFVSAVRLTIKSEEGQPDQNTTATETEDNSDPETPAAFDAEKIDTALQAWAARQSGVYSVTIMDGEGEVLAEANGDREYFAASIYKLYVAYAGYQKVDDGSFNPDAPYIGGKNIEECLHETIRSSDSPCAEKMMAEIGQANITRQMESYGLRNTSMTSITTSAHDAATILARLHKGEDLSSISRRRFLESMETQIYRDALAKGFSDFKVMNKVGFREQDEYHDVALVELEDGRTLIVSVLTINVGTRNIAALAEALQAALQTP